MRHNPGCGIMTELVKCRAMPVDRLEIGLRWRDLHIIVFGHVEGAATADPEIDARCLDQRLDLGLDQSGLWRWCGDHEILWQAFALRQVEHGEALEERDRLCFLAGLLRPFLLVVGNEAVAGWNRTERAQRVWTSRVSATGAGSLSPSPQPVTENPSAL
jgi:hypothetical protein